MSRSDDKVQKMIRDARLFRDFKDSAGWRVFEQFLRDGVIARQNRLCEFACDADETNRLRGEIQLLNRLIRFPTMLDEEAAKAVKHLAYLQDRQSRMQDYGWTEKESRHEEQVL